MRFFLKHNLIGYFQGLDENTNSLEEAGVLNSTNEGRRKLCHVNALHRHVSDITSIVRKVASIDTFMDRVVEKLPWLKHVWICEDLARRVVGNIIDCIIVGQELDAEYIAGLSGKVHKLIDKKVKTYVMTEIKDETVKASLLMRELNTNMTPN
jgi:hypothetical protein